MLAPTERAPDSRPSPLPLPSAFLAAELGPVVMADDLCEAAFGSATPTGPRNYYRARYYDPKLGRFLSEDPLPIGQRKLQELSAYSYVGNNPNNFIDPSGLLAVCCRPAKSTGGIKCHCWIRFDDGTTLGAYNRHWVLMKAINYPDDHPTPDGSTCHSLPLGRCDEEKLLNLFWQYPAQTPYSVNPANPNTSNTPVSYWMQQIGWGGLPSCAWGQIPPQTGW